MTLLLYLLGVSLFIQGLSIMLNLLGFSVPIPLCLWEGVTAQYVALLGYIPPVLALLTIIGYIIA